MFNKKEQEIQGEILEYLHLRGFYAQRINSGCAFVGYGDKKQRIKLADFGTPDIIACICGKFVGIEVKRTEKHIKAWTRQWQSFLKEPVLNGINSSSVNQHKEQEKIRKAGGITLVVCSVNDVENDLIKLGLI